MRNTYIWLRFALALIAVAAIVAAPSMAEPSFAGGTKMDIGPEDGTNAGMGDPDMPDTGRDPNTTQGSLAFDRIDSGRNFGLSPQPGITEVTRIAAEPEWKLWLRAIGVLFGTRIGWF